MLSYTNMNKITLQRVRYTDDATFGFLTVGRHIVATLEDTVRDHKLWGITAIPVGTYKLELRTEGGKTKEYGERFPDMHEGMVWLRGVPNFEYIYIHIGNFPEDTEGCILVGERATSDSLLSSSKAYQRIYPTLVQLINEGCEITVQDREGSHK